ncbi:hypothetical protein EX461_23960 [Vibrio parahaemolyticus]|nr:hypothetical protein [Vibrio parahaemolyticus]EJG0013986.1 hypothetical protein [Vibrio parahaemolyticus]EJG0782027.1 hypothetical protein [Vibrio parahaemolyticus]EJS9799237.1 hypothetical protein [Vibrio parahaemolyticus]
MYNLKHFKIEELVSKSMFERRGSKCIELFDPRALKTLDDLRTNLNKPITVNNWCYGGNLEQRGLRDRSFYKSDSEYISSLSQHKYGRAFDFSVKGMDSDEVRKHIHNNKHLYPHISFLETDISWCHFDVRNGTYKIWSPKRGYVDEP